MSNANPRPPRGVPHRFLVAFSFAGEQRELVLDIAKALEQRLGRGTVFLDEWFRHELPGGPSDLKLQRIYQQAELVVVCASRQYGEKCWPLVEWDSIRGRYMKLRADPDQNAVNRILPVRVGEGEVEGLLPNTIWDDARNDIPKAIANRIVHRLRRFVPEAGKPCVFVAECTPDLEDEESPVNRSRLKAFLEEDLDCFVLPRVSLCDPPVNEYRSRLETELRKGLAFVQLLGPYPWKGGNYDRVQHEAAQQIGLPMFRFRIPMDLAKLQRADAAHHQFTTEGVIAGGFEDFKHLLRDQLAGLVQQREQAIRRAQDEEQSPDSEPNPPLVRVAIHAQQPDALWETIFPWLYEHANVLHDQLAQGETFKEKHLGEPCHGFLILCDSAALDDRHSPRGDMEHCRLIQMQEKDPARRPPVALVYWPPPQANWARLLRSTPQRLHRVEGDRLGNLAPFIEQVRQVRRGSP